MIYSENEAEKDINNVDLNELIQIIKKLIMNNEIDKAMEICKREEFKDIIAIQSQLITILLKKGRIKEAKEICNREKFKGNVTIQSQYITILLGEKRTEEAIEICNREKFKNNPTIQSRLIKILIKKRSIKEIKEICNREAFKGNTMIQTQLITILLQEGEIEEAKKICERDELKDNAEIQAKLLTILYMEERIKGQDNTETIGDRFGGEISSIIRNLQEQQKNEQGEIRKLERMAKMPYRDIRARMQLVIYLNRYGMGEIAEQRLKNESQIYQEIYRLVFVAQDRKDIIEKDLKKSRLIHSLKRQIIVTGGNGEYAEELIDKAIKKGQEESQERE